MVTAASRGCLGPGQGAERSCENWQLTVSMGPVWAEVCIFAQRATTPSQRFFLHFSSNNQSQQTDSISYQSPIFCGKTTYSPSLGAGDLAFLEVE